ncbi:hypothetical protein C8J57DRAFT_1537328 [Mycena rebaudengoi]|nr:hypothetical protein C8J57DRAFT_1537328 [Mycena rebaudengoi]
MHFSTSFISLLATCLLACVRASPVASVTSDLSDPKYTHGSDGIIVSVGTPSNGSEIEKRTPGGVFICDELNWGGRCGYAVQPLDVCIQLGSDWTFQISSFRPDDGATCYAYSKNSCSDAGSVWSFHYPGDATGGWGTDNPWDDRIASFKCEPDNGGSGSEGSGTFTGDGNYEMKHQEQTSVLVALVALP